MTGLPGTPFFIGRVSSTHDLDGMVKKCPAHRNKAEIKCMGSAGGKTPTEPKVYSFFSSLNILSKIEYFV